MTVQASSFLLNIHHQPTSSTTINHQHQQLLSTIINKQPYQLNQPTPKTKKDLYKIATPGIPFKRYVKWN